MILLLIAMVTNSMAAVQSKPFEYSSASQKMEGTLAMDADKKGKQPAVLIVHDWMGNSAYFETVASKLAGEGYVSLAVDMYGKGVRPKDTGEAGKFAGKYKGDRKLLREQIRAAYDKVTALPNVDKNRVIVIGYCFGGTVALELARSGAQLAGVATFHGGLETPTPQDAKNIKARVLVMHGADDPYVPAKEVAAFETEMKTAKVKYKLVQYPGAVHSFTNPAAGYDNSKGAAYNADADKKSWAEFEGFLKEVAKN